MYSEVKSVAVSGLEAVLVTVETDASAGLPEFTMSGYLSSQVVDAKERIRVAIKNSGIELRPQRILVNISPADIRKAGTGFDLPIAVGLLVANGIVSQDVFSNAVFVGELSLDGRINPVRGVISCVIAAKESGINKIFVPYDNLQEAYIIEDIAIIGVRHLRELIEYGKDTEMSGLIEGKESDSYKQHYNTIKNCEKLIRTEKIDYSDIAGQLSAKRATVVAVAGMHNIIYIGPPGSGKTMMAQRISTIMPDMDYEECVMLTKIYSIAGKLGDRSALIDKRPFRAPHHTITAAAMLGGGTIPRPGEITLANSGVMFLDEMTEYNATILESLRQPLEDKKIRLVRVSKEYEFPCNFMLAAAMNPCKCGYYPDRNKCNCSEKDIRRYIGRISQPMWDRFDISVNVSKVDYSELANATKDFKMTSAYMAELVKRAHEFQRKRFHGSEIRFNSQMSVADVQKFCVLETKEKRVMEKAYERFNMSARGYMKILKTARTIADIEESEKITVKHLSEAFSYRNCNIN